MKFLPFRYALISCCVQEGNYVSQSSNKLNRRLTQTCGFLFGIAIAVWVLRGFGILGFMPGGVIWLLFLAAIAFAILSYMQKTWWRF